jgi:hypothetical protein
MRTVHCDPDRGDMCQLGAQLALEFEMQRRRYENNQVDRDTYLEALHSYQNHIDECRVWDFEGIPILKA